MSLIHVFMKSEVTVWGCLFDFDYCSRQECYPALLVRGPSTPDFSSHPGDQKSEAVADILFRECAAKGQNKMGM